MHELRAHFLRLFAYDAWANREELAKVGASEPALRLLGHILNAQKIWSARLAGEMPATTPWDLLTLDECSTAIAEMETRWPAVIDAIDLEGGVEYRNTKGDVFHSRIPDVLAHVAMHGAYHRGQIATHLRSAGETPAVTDFIHCTRLGIL